MSNTADGPFCSNATSTSANTSGPLSVPKTLVTKQVFKDISTGRATPSRVCISNARMTKTQVIPCIHKDYYTSTTLKGCNGTDPSEIKKVDSYDLDQVFDVDFGGDMTTQYDYEGIQVYPKAMVYNGVAYTLQENVTTLEGSGTATVPYLIKTTYDLDLVASYVNKGKSFTEKYFKLCNDLTYDGNAGNYTAIGYYEDGSASGCCFDGVFNGYNHCISGINIHKDGTTSADKYQGIFGWTGENAIVRELMVSNCTFDGFSNTGAISGRNDGLITNCHVLDGVSVNAVAAKNAFMSAVLIRYNRYFVQR